VRILLVSHPPLTPESGAAQVALNLAAALTARGHEAIAWSPEPLPSGTRWWNLWRRQTRAIERFVASSGPFDAIDTPAITASARLARAGRLIVRSIQPELLYLAAELRAQWRRPSGKVLAHSLYGGAVSLAILGGWRRARVIVCQGSRELEWMRRRFPRWSAKLRCYAPAPSAAEQEALAVVRRERRGRRPPAPGAGIRFLWMGRWVTHKGTDRLAAFLRERAASHPADTFTLAGCGPEAARDCPPGLVESGRVRLLPSYARATLPALLAEHDAGLFTSTIEGWGLSLNEMLESGLPVFAADAGGVADLRPFFPRTLQPFPPPAGGGLPEPDDPQATGYYDRFRWTRIAQRYEEQALA
jgi:glycosyltransferase involved in cell wall biosynthesis